MKKWIFIFANLCFLYMLLLCIINPIENIKSYNVNNSAPFKTNDTIKKASPTPFIFCKEWYISENPGPLNIKANNIIILGLGSNLNTLKLNVQLQDAINGNQLFSNLYKWSSSNEKIATVKDSLVTGLSPGKVTIYAERSGQIRTYDISVYSSDDVELVTEVNDESTTSEINIDSPIYLRSYILIKNTNYKYEIPFDNIFLKWNSSDLNKLLVDINFSTIAIPCGTGNVNLTAEFLGKSSKLYFNITKPDKQNIKYSVNDKTYYMKVYDKKEGSDTKYLSTYFSVPFEILVPDSKGKIIDISNYISWQSSEPQVSAFNKSRITALSPGYSVYTAKFFDYTFTFNTEVSKFETFKPEFSSTPTEPITDIPPYYDPAYPFDKDNPSSMSEINKKIISLLKDNIKDPELISYLNKNSVRIETIKTGYFTQQIEREIIVSIFLEVNSGTTKEILGIFDSETFKYKTHKIFTVKAHNSIFINRSSILYIPIDPDQDNMANTVEVWTVKDGYWKINSKISDAQYHRYAVTNGHNIIMVFDKVNKKDLEWEFKYRLYWNINKLSYYNEIYDNNENLTDLELADIPNEPQDINNKNTDNEIKVTGLHVICNNLISKMDKFRDAYTYNTEVYEALRRDNTDKSAVASKVRLIGIEYGYFTQTNKLEILAIFEPPAFTPEGTSLRIMVVCDAENYNILAQTIFMYSYGNPSIDIIKDETGTSRILYSVVSNRQGDSVSLFELYEVNGSTFNTVLDYESSTEFSDGDGFALVGDKLIVLRRIYIEGINGTIGLPWEYKCEYNLNSVYNVF